MTRIKVGVTAHRRHKHILKLAKGYRGAKHLLFRKANETVMKALPIWIEDCNCNHPHSGLKMKSPREFRSLKLAS